MICEYIERIPVTWSEEKFFEWNSLMNIVNFINNNNPGSSSIFNRISQFEFCECEGNTFQNKFSHESLSNSNDNNFFQMSEKLSALWNEYVMSWRLLCLWILKFFFAMELILRLINNNNNHNWWKEWNWIIWRK